MAMQRSESGFNGCKLNRDRAYQGMCAGGAKTFCGLAYVDMALQNKFKADMYFRLVLTSGVVRCNLFGLLAQPC